MSLSSPSSERAALSVLLRVVGLLRRQPGLGQQRQHAEDRIHRRANFVAGIGQELALRPRRRLRGFGGLHQFGDVDAKADGVAIGHLAIDDPQRAAVVELLGQGGMAGPVLGDPFGNPLVDAPDSRRNPTALAPLRTISSKLRTGHQHAGQRPVDLAVFLVAEDQPVVGVVDDEGLADGIDRAAQQFGAALDFGFGIDARADIAVGADESAARQRRTADFQHRLLGAARDRVAALRDCLGPGR